MSNAKVGWFVVGGIAALFITFFSINKYNQEHPYPGIQCEQCTNEAVEKWETSYFCETHYEPYFGFSNDYGNPTTKCRSVGCEEYISKSGDTAYCSNHSSECANCHCDIDRDATFCMDCLESYFN